jgi:hypothetical protein
MDPGMAGQAIRPSVPMAGAPTAGPAPTTPSRGVINPQAGRVYDRMFAKQDDMRDRREYLEDQKRIRRQELRDDVRDRNREIDDEDRKRLEVLADREERYRREDAVDKIEWDRGAPEREAAAKKNQLFFKEKRRQRQEQKESEIMTLKKGFAAILDVEAGSGNLEEVRKNITLARQEFARQRLTNKEQLNAGVIVDVDQIMNSGEAEDDDIEFVENLMEGITGREGASWKDVPTLNEQQKKLLTSKLIEQGRSKDQAFGGIQGKLQARLTDHSEQQKQLNDLISEYDQMSLKISSKQSSKEGISIIKEAFKSRLVELTDDPNVLDGYSRSGLEEEGADESSVAKGKTEGGETASEKEFDEFALKKKEEGDLEKNVDRKRIALEEAKDDSFYSPTLDTAEAISDAATFVTDGLGELDLDGGDAATIASVAVPSAMTAKNIVDDRRAKNELKVKKKEASLKRINDRIKTQGYFTQAKDINTFLSNNNMKPFSEPMPTESGDPRKDLRNRYEYEQKLANHMDSELKVKTDSFSQRVKKKLATKGTKKLAARAGLATAVYEAIVLGKALGQELGWIKQDPEVVEAAKELAEAQKAVLEYKQARMQQAKEAVVELKDLKSGGIDASSAPTARGIEGLDESNATSQEIQGAMDRMEEDGDLAPIPQTIKP